MGYIVLCLVPSHLMGYIVLCPVPSHLMGYIVLCPVTRSQSSDGLYSVVFCSQEPVI